MIKPTVGRVVWYTPYEGDPSISTNYTPPFTGHVAYVWSDRCVNLMVISPEGQPLQKTSVTLLQEGDARPSGGGYCEWMPFQKGQAAKAEALEKQVEQGRAT